MIYKENQYFVFKIDENNCVKIWSKLIGVADQKPMILQENHPSGRKWETTEEAEAWAKEFTRIE